MRCTTLALLFIALPLHADDLGLKAPPNFKVTLWADHILANDIFTMALDEKGRVVVSGPGYVRLLEDTKGTGKADKATDVEQTKTGLMGLYYSQGELKKYCMMSGDGQIIQTIEAPKDDGGTTRWTSNFFTQSWKFSEHGGHAIKAGPEGGLYAIAGNDAALASLRLRPTSPVRTPEAGGMLRFPYFMDWRNVDPDVIAHGFRNPYDFDFTPYGDIITFDSDTERDYLLPWYVPTRVYHVLPGAHHGWRLTGFTRSLGRPDYYPDTVEMLADMGRGSPTAVCCYRHTQFPKHYRGGVFLADWTFGKIYYMPLIPEGSSYKKVKPEVFLESTGTNGFAPTAMRVGPDGSLFISIGGRGTRGAVYKVEYLIDGKARVIPPGEPITNLDRVLNAPQPLEAWSMAKWKPIEYDIPMVDLVRVAEDENESDERRIRAVEITVRAGYRPSSGIAPPTESRSALVRARAAWATGYQSIDETWNSLCQLISDPHPRVKVAALNSLADKLAGGGLNRSVDVGRLLKCLGDDDHRVQLAATRLVQLLPIDTRRVLLKRASEFSARTVAALAVAEAVPDGLAPDYFFAVVNAMDRTRRSEDRLELLRAIQICLGDWNLTKPGLELWSAYALNGDRPQDAAYHRLVLRGMIENVLAQFPSTDPVENIETGRLLAMLQDDHSASVAKVLSQITGNSHPTSDFHYVTVLSRLTAPRTEEQTRRVAAALLGIEKKLAGRQLRIKQNWTARMGELTGELLRVHPGLDKLLAAHPAIAQPGHVVVASKLTGAARGEVAVRLFNAFQADAEFPLSAELLDLFALLPRAEVRPALRARWSDLALREAMIHLFTEKPAAEDRERFLDVAETANGDTLHASLQGLMSLPRDKSPKNLTPLLRRLRQGLSDPKDKTARLELIEVINRQAGQGFQIFERSTDAKSLAESYRPVFAWFESAHPAEARRLNAVSDDEVAVRELIGTGIWLAGDLERGRGLFRDRCQTCHGGSTRLGPDLAGVSKRLSRDDLLTAIVNPSRDVAPAYRTSNIDLKDGKRITGIVVFESADGLLVQTGATETKRIAAVDIENRTPSTKSLMPDGLLRGLRPKDIFDLFAYLEKQ
ncbi:MAG TPA: c-type cytochrome [Gemmataceae bacterium]|jgi:putative heme-binding domain-containing protein|nr:c-type cytochrome [Gemmataceae bacterium]